MAEPVSYKQIVRELAVKKKLKPWEVAMSSEQEIPLTAEQAAPLAMSEAVDPMNLAAKLEMRNKMLSPMGEVANPETMMAQKPQHQGLLQLLLGLIR